MTGFFIIILGMGQFSPIHRAPTSLICVLFFFTQSIVPSLLNRIQTPHGMSSSAAPVEALVWIAVARPLALATALSYAVGTSAASVGIACTSGTR